MWRELVERWYPVHEFRPGATSEALTAAEQRIGHQLPGDLRELLAETDGVRGSYGLGLIWPIERIVDENLMLRSEPDFRDLSMPFEPLLFFGDAGNGDLFAFRLVSVLWDRDVYAWNHENDSRVWVASSLAQYLEWWSDGRITV